MRPEEHPPIRKKGVVCDPQVKKNNDQFFQVNWL